MKDTWVKIDETIVVLETKNVDGKLVEEGFVAVVEEKGESRRARAYIDSTHEPMVTFARWREFIPASVRVLPVGFNPEHRKIVERNMIDYAAGRKPDMTRYNIVNICDCEGTHGH